MYRGQRVAVVIPAYNEERFIGRTIRTVPEWVDFIVVVDDRSHDDTALVVRAHATRRLTFVRMERNSGVGGAILRGYRESLRLGADAIAVMAGDGQMAPDELGRLVDPVVEGEAEYVKGDRLGHPELLERMPFVRVAGNVALSMMTKVATGYWHVRDSQCGYTVISRAAAERLDDDAIYPRYGFPNDLLAHLAEHGARVVDRPVTPIYGSEESGIRWPVAIFTYSALLGRIWLRRVRNGRSREPLATDVLSLQDIGVGAQAVGADARSQGA